MAIVQKTATSYPTSYSTNGSINGTNYTSAIGKGSDTSSTSGNDYASGGTAYIDYAFTFDIPETATIDSVTCTVKGHLESTSQSSEQADCQLYAGSTAKGSVSSFSDTSDEVLTLNTGTWTREEIDSLVLRFTIGYYGGKVSGATVNVTYSYNDVSYNVYVTSNVSEVTVSPSSESVSQGASFTATFNTNDITDYAVTDNDIDVTDQLVRHEVINSGTLNNSPASLSTTSGIKNNSNYANYAVGHTAESPNTYSSNMYASKNSTGYADYTFDFSSIPENATITNVEVKCNGKRESSTISTYYRSSVGVYYNSTQKGDEENFTSTSQQTITMSNPGTWTRDELQNAHLRFTVGYYGGALYGVTWSVTYTLPNTGDEYYYTYTLTNVTAEHIIVIDIAGAYVPPEEDPTLTYYPVTISSINATTSPNSGTTRVVEGTSETITITPSETQVTLILDNGVDVSNQLVSHLETPTYTIDSVSGASYGFTLNSSSGYYVSNNKGKASSAALARINLNLPSTTNVIITYINYAEATYDYGIFGNVDSALGTSYTADSDVKLACSSSSDNSSSPQTLTYQVEAGTHFIDVKYRKDNYTDSNNDTLQFKVELVSVDGAGYYTYELSNITESHNLVFIFGDVEYYFINANGTNCRLYPNGQVVSLVNGNYKLNIVPDDITATVTATDNNTDVTSKLEKQTGTDKSGNEVVSYSYTLTDITMAHTLTITCAIESGSYVYFKLEVGSPWIKGSKVWVKDENNRWVVQEDVTKVFDPNTHYRKG